MLKEEAVESKVQLCCCGCGGDASVSHNVCRECRQVSVFINLSVMLMFMLFYRGRLTSSLLCGIEFIIEGCINTAICKRCNESKQVQLLVRTEIVNSNELNCIFFTAKVPQQTVCVRGIDILFTMCPPHEQLNRTQTLLFTCIWNEDPHTELMYHFTQYAGFQSRSKSYIMFMQYQSKANTKKIITILTILLTPCSKLNLMVIDESDNVFIWDSKAITDNLSESVVLKNVGSLLCEELCRKKQYFITNFGPYGQVSDKNGLRPWKFISGIGIPVETKNFDNSPPYVYNGNKIKIDNQINESFSYYTDLNGFSVGCILQYAGFTSCVDRFVFAGVISET